MLTACLHPFEPPLRSCIDGAIRHYRFIGASDGRWHVIEQAGKEAHTVTAPGLLTYTCSSGFKNGGNSGNVGNAQCFRGVERSKFVPTRFFVGTVITKNNGRQALLY